MEESDTSSSVSLVEQLRRENERLRGIINEMETRLSPTVVIERLLLMLIEHYKNQRLQGTARSSGSAPVLSQPMYATDKMKSCYHALPSNVEHMVENLWLGRVNEYVIDCQGDKQAILKLHATRVHDDLPLPVVQLTNGTVLLVARCLSHRLPRFLAKNDPQLAGLVVDTDSAIQWAKRADLSHSQQVVSWIAHKNLAKLFNLWLNRDDKGVPASSAVMTVDASLVRIFVNAMATHSNARCHFTCTGEERLYGYLVLTANDGLQTDLQRLYVGSMLL